MKWLFRIENVLVVLPFGILLFGLFMFFQNGGDLFITPGELRWYFLINIFLLSTTQWLFILFPGYLIHYFLRTIKRRNKIIAIGHVILTAILLVYISGISDDMATSLIPGWHTRIYAPASFGVNGGFPWLELLFWFVQLLFIGYGVITIRRWRNSPA